MSVRLSEHSITLTYIHKNIVDLDLINPLNALIEKKRSILAFNSYLHRLMLFLVSNRAWLALTDLVKDSTTNIDSVIKTQLHINILFVIFRIIIFYFIYNLKDTFKIVVSNLSHCPVTKWNNHCAFSSNNNGTRHRSLNRLFKAPRHNSLRAFSAESIKFGCPRCMLNIGNKSHRPIAAAIEDNSCNSTVVRVVNLASL